MVDNCITHSSLAVHVPLLRLKGLVIHGKGLGKKLFQVPTANLDPESYKNVLDHVECGVYIGLCQLHNSIYKCVTHIGWNVFFSGTSKTVECHLLNEFEEDFYGEEIAIILCGFIRPEKNFSSLIELQQAINQDIEKARPVLDLICFKSIKSDNFFSYSQ